MEAAYDYLESNYVIHRSTENGVAKVYPIRLWNSEQLIVKHMAELLHRHKEDPCEIELDFNRYSTNILLADN